MIKDIYHTELGACLSVGYNMFDRSILAWVQVLLNPGIGGSRGPVGWSELMPGQESPRSLQCSNMKREHRNIIPIMTHAPPKNHMYSIYGKLYLVVVAMVTPKCILSIRFVSRWRMFNA